MTASLFQMTALHKNSRRALWPIYSTAAMSHQRAVLQKKTPFLLNSLQHYFSYSLEIWLSAITKGHEVHIITLMRPCHWTGTASERSKWENWDVGEKKNAVNFT